MTALTITITDAGRAALIAAAGTNAITIATAGLTATAFAPDPSLSAIPAEVKRVAAVSGMAVDASTVHLTVRDASDDIYDLRGFGLYLDDGTLFALYSQPDPIIGKAAVTTLFLACDLTFADGEADLIQFGDTNFLDPPATETSLGLIRIATVAEALAGAVANGAMTPATMAAVLENYVSAAALAQPGGVATLDATGKLAMAQRPPVDLVDVWPVADEPAMLALAATVGDFAVRADLGRVYVLQAAPAATLANWLEISTPAPVMSVNGQVGAVVLSPADIGAVPTTRTVTGGGLVTGGGALSANRTLSVTAATVAEANDATRTDVAITPASLADILTRIAASVPATLSLIHI